jgi:hypothetical protein
VSAFEDRRSLVRQLREAAFDEVPEFKKKKKKIDRTVAPANLLKRDFDVGSQGGNRPQKYPRALAIPSGDSGSYGRVKYT